MTKVINKETEQADSKVGIAVEFLNDVSKQQYNEADLRRYLSGKQGLSSDQVDEAFKIHRCQSNTSRDTVYNEMLEPEVKLSSSRSGSRDRGESSCDRKERFFSDQKTSEDKKSSMGSNLLILQPGLRKEGDKLIRDFLVCERGYCIVLECMVEEYHRELLIRARRGSISLGLDEVNKMFQPIPKLLAFHKALYTDMMKGSNIGRLFYQRISFFKGYSEYIKHATSVIELLRKHVFDLQLHKCLNILRRKSRLKRNNLSDLMLTPLDRMMDYQSFLRNFNM